MSNNGARYNYDGEEPPQLPEKFSRAKVEFRRTEIAKLLIRGWGPSRIAEHLSLPVNTVSTDIKVMEAQWRSTQLEQVEKVALYDLMRLEQAVDRLMPIIEKEGVEKAIKAVDALAKVIQLRGDILGYRQGVTVDIESYVRAVAEANGFDPERAVELAQKVVISIR